MATTSTELASYLGVRAAASPGNGWMSRLLSAFHASQMRAVERDMDSLLAAKGGRLPDGQRPLSSGSKDRRAKP